MNRIIPEFKPAHLDVYTDLNDIFYGLFTSYVDPPRIRALSAYYLGYFENQVERASPEEVIQELKRRGLGDKDKAIRKNSKIALENLGVKLNEVSLIQKLKDTYVLGEGDMAGTYIYADRWLNYQDNKGITFSEDWRGEIKKVNNLLPALIGHLKKKGLTPEEMDLFKLKDFYPVDTNKSGYAISMYFRYPGLADPVPITSTSLIARKINKSWEFDDVYYTYHHQGDNGTFYCSIHDIFDLNNDRKDELIFNCTIWEGSYFKVFSLNSDNKYIQMYEGN